MGFGISNDSLFVLKLFRKPENIISLVIDVSLTCIETNQICYAVFDTKQQQNDNCHFHFARQLNFTTHMFRQQSQLTFKVCITIIHIEYEIGM